MVLVPAFLSDFLLSSRTLTGILMNPKARTNPHSEASFQYCGPRLWNSQRTRGPRRVLICLKVHSGPTSLVWLLIKLMHLCIYCLLTVYTFSVSQLVLFYLFVIAIISFFICWCFQDCFFITVCLLEPTVGCFNLLLQSNLCSLCFYLLPLVFPHLGQYFLSSVQFLSVLKVQVIAVGGWMDRRSQGIMCICVNGG